MTGITHSWAAATCLALFLLAYTLVVFEEKLHLKKSNPVVLLGCGMWLVIGLYESRHGNGGRAHEFAEHLIAEIGALFFFLFVAMTYINVLTERNLFAALRSWLLRLGLGFRGLFWATGALAFCISPAADNMTTALFMATIALAVSGGNPKFIVPAIVNVVVAANAGGAWSPFGDITTLMVWTARKVDTVQFLYLFVPSLVNWAVPALVMTPFLPAGKPLEPQDGSRLKDGALFIAIFFIITIIIAVCFHQFLHLPPYLGMMLGLGLLMFTGYYLQKLKDRINMLRLGVESERRGKEFNYIGNLEKRAQYQAPQTRAGSPGFDLFEIIKQNEFDTLLFFFGILNAVGALQYLGYLALASQGLYGNMEPTAANTLIGAASAIIDNIPLMYAVLKMDPAMALDQWLLITLTTGVGGSLLSIGSAAGVACMGLDRKNYTFLSHLRWTPAVALGYAASILAWWLAAPHPG